ncbi:hypothetical protein LZ30DRAFT_402423 [Colletotrichum cereale]|nr:hypothetical protein LZ30DRAFT_402423 [Colletotrichum cereale]
MHGRVRRSGPAGLLNVAFRMALSTEVLSLVSPSVCAMMVGWQSQGVPRIFVVVAPPPHSNVPRAQHCSTSALVCLPDP